MYVFYQIFITYYYLMQMKKTKVQAMRLKNKDIKLVIEFRSATDVN